MQNGLSQKKKVANSQESESPWSDSVLDYNLIPNLSWLITANKGFCIRAIKWERSLKRALAVHAIFISVVALAPIPVLSFSCASIM